MASVELQVGHSEQATVETVRARSCAVRRRRRRDPMSISSAADFEYGEPREVSAIEASEDSNVTLYCLDPPKSEAIFVQCDPGTALSDYPFYYQGQFRHAKSALVMSLTDMHDVANHMGDRFQRAVMIHSVGRCGSTLLSKMFARLNCCLSLSEPDVYTQILAEAYAEQETVELLRSTNRLYYRPLPGTSPTHLVLKFRSFCVEMASQMELATPSAVSLFLYRDVERVVRSGMRVFRYRGAPLCWVDQLHKWIVTRPALGIGLWWNRSLGQRLFPAIDRFTTWELSRMGPVGVLAMAWVSSMERCVRLLRDGLTMPAIRYDDLVAHPESIAAQLTQICGLPDSSVNQMREVMDRDSQQGTVIDRGQQRNYELSRQDRDTIRLVLSRSDIIDSVDFQIPGTLVFTGS